MLNDEGNVEINIQEKLRSTRKKEAEDDKRYLQLLMEDFPAFKQILRENANNEDLVAFSFTEVPLELDRNGYWKRIVKKNEDDYGIELAEDKEYTGPTGVKTNFVLSTGVTRGDKVTSGENAGLYKYTCVSYAIWKEHSVLGGAKYPASGNDFFMQTTPKGLTRYSDSFTAYYSKNRRGVNGTDFARIAGSTKYLKYSVVDDPLGMEQLELAKLTSVHYAKPGTGRMLNSYYTHTWKQLSLSVQVTAGKDDNYELAMTPSIKDKSWNIYSYTTFNA